MPSKHKIIKADTIESVKRRFGIVGNAAALNRAIDMALRVAPTNMNVLVTGENGSGKESFSKIIHYYSSQKHGKLIAVNCGAIPEGTIDSELFGHEKGSFTGAHEARKGYFQEASHGTIFLDEIGEMPLATQARLLRVLEYGEFMRVGSSKIEKTEVRVIAATHIDLMSAVEEGTFREDLYYRLNTVSLRIPPLRERGDDILLLFKKFTVDFAEEYGGVPLTLTPEAAEILEHYPFPGNVRELKNLVVRMSVLEHRDPIITAETIKNYLPNRKKRLPAPLSDDLETDSRLSEREILYKVLFDMQRDLIELKKIIFEEFSRETTSHHVLKKHPLLFKKLESEEASDMPTIALPTQEREAINTTSAVVSEEDIIEEELIDTSEKVEILPLEEMEKQAIAHALKRYKNSRKQAAKALAIPERTLYRKIKRYNL